MEIYVDVLYSVYVCVVCLCACVLLIMTYHDLSLFIITYHYLLLFINIYHDLSLLIIIYHYILLTYHYLSILISFLITFSLTVFYPFVVYLVTIVGVPWEATCAHSGAAPGRSM